MNADTFKGILYILAIVIGTFTAITVISKLIDVLVNLVALTLRKLKLMDKGKLILFLTGVATILELLYPPRAIIRLNSKFFLGFHPIWETEVNNHRYVSIDSSLLIIEIIVTLFIGLSIYHLIKFHNLEDERNIDSSLSKNQSLSEDLNNFASNIAKDLEKMRKSWFKSIINNVFKENFAEKEILNDNFNEKIDLIIKAFQLGLVLSFLEKKKYLSPSKEENLENLLFAYMIKEEELKDFFTYFERYWNSNIDNTTTISRFIIDISSCIVGRKKAPIALPFLAKYILPLVDSSIYVIAYAFQDKEEIRKIKNTFKRNLILKENSSQQTLIKKAEDFLPFMILQMRDEDLERLDKDYPDKKERDRILITMLLNPKEKWKELGVPDYLMKYEIADDE